MGKDKKTPLRVLITAGPTVEDIDPVRFISNRSSGTLGFALARAAAKAGMGVTLIHGPVDSAILKSAPKKKSFNCIAVRSAAEMHGAVMKHAGAVDAVIMNAAVADYTVGKISGTKLKKTAHGLTLTLKPTADILKELGQLKTTRKKDLMLVGFALETGEGKTHDERKKSALAYALKKMNEKNMDAIVLNTPVSIGALNGNYTLMTRGQDQVMHFATTKKKFAKALVKYVGMCFE